uniref:Gamma-interferon-inducible lysosomal thiol reductase n=2 Tax=Denticeps clupeoides TaxID=299321 RepID=A0AAY4EIF3_9TELE
NVMEVLFCWTLLLSLLCGICRSRASHKPSCGYPPSQWCRSLEIAIECEVQKQCLELNSTKPNSDVPALEVTLYYESLCPGCRAFLTEQLFPTWTMLKDIMKVHLVPYGNAEERQNSVICQHGENECLGNMLESCIIHAVDHVAFQIIYCMESSSDVLKAAQLCLQLYAPSVRWETISSCATGAVGRSLMHKNAVKTRFLEPAHTHVPWVTFNGEYRDDWEDGAMSSLFSLVCSLYKGAQPPACTGVQKKLDRSFCLRL